MKFTHLHTHSHYSLLNGLSKIDDLLDRCKELGMDSLALTDYGVLYGAVEFSIKAKELGIKPIIGCTLYVAPNGLHNKNNTTEDRTRNHLIVLVKNEQGYKNLMKLITIAHLEGFYYKPRVDHEALAAHSEGLVVLSGGSNGEVAKALTNGNRKKAIEIATWYQETFGAENYYLELQDHPNFEAQKTINKGLQELSKELNIPLVATGNSHYIHKEDAAIHDILICIQSNRKVHETDRWSLKDFDLSFRSPEEMAAAFPDLPEALENTQKIADMCNFEVPMGETQLPYFPLPEGKDADGYLREMCEDGLTRHYGDAITDEHRKRMEYELEIIGKTGYASYFLIVQDFTNWARDNGIVVGPGRGSAAGSFVSYLVGITNMDPIEYNLLFERFLNPERVSMPDVDLDFADDRRDDVLNYVREKYGNDHVAQIITFGTMAARAAIRDVGRALGLPYDFCDKTAKFIPMFSSISEALETVPEFKQLYSQDDDARRLIDSAKRMEGVARHASIHACGVVITDKPVVEYTPLQSVTGHENSMVTQYSSSTKSSFVEKIGLLKMDFLGLKNLTIIQNTLNIVKRLYGKEIDIEKISLEDPLAYKLLQDGHTTGIFQLESSGMRRYLKQLVPNELEDIIAMVSLYRPGPMELIPDFVDRKHGRKEVTYLHPKLEPILGDTYGIAIYQEQIMRITQDLAGFTLGEADILRKAMGKKIMDLIKEQRIKFVKGCVENKIDKKTAEQVFDFIEPFAGYGFNRSHAACYGLIGYQTAFLKAHFPAPFMAALMTSDQGNTDRIAIEAHECVEMGITVMPPDVNESFEEFAVIDDAAKGAKGAEASEEGTQKNQRIRFGLNAIKNVGHNVATTIVAERKKNGPYKDLSDLLTRVTAKDMNKKSLEALAKVGALDSFAERNQVLASMENLLLFSKELTKAAASNQNSLFGAQQLTQPTVQLVDADPAKKKQKLAWEKELLGLYVSDHPVSEYQAYLNDYATPINNLTKDIVDQTIQVGGVIAAAKKIITKKRQQTMAFATVEDMTGQTEVVIFPKLYETTSGVWQEGQVVLMTGKLAERNGEVSFLADDVKALSDADLHDAQRIIKTKQKYEGGKLTTNDQQRTTRTSKEEAKTMNHAEPDVQSAHGASNKQLTTKEPKEATPDDDTGIKAQGDTTKDAKDVPEDTPAQFVIALPADATQETIAQLTEVLNGCQQGPTAIFLKHGVTTMHTPYKITLDTVAQQKIRQIAPSL